MTLPNLNNRERLKLIALTLPLTAVISELLTAFVDIPGPCQMGPGAYLACLQDHAYPSVHVGLAFSLVYPLLGTALLPLAYLLGLLTAWLKLSTLHSWYDIGGGISVAGLSYSIAEGLVLKQKNVAYKEDERPRKVLHAAVGLLFCSMIWFLGMEAASLLLLAGTCAGILNMHLVLSGLKLPGTDLMMDKFERGGVLPGEGSLYYALGVLFAMGLLRDNPRAAVAVILILSIGDSLATIVGVTYGRHHLPWNRRKTFEGSAAFLVGAMFSLAVMPSVVIALIAASAAIMESLPLKADDNITVPVVASLLFFFLI